MFWDTKQFRANNNNNNNKKKKKKKNNTCIELLKTVKIILNASKN